MCVCILALVTRHGKRTRRIVLSSVVCPAVQIFFFHIISLTARFFGGKNVVEYEICVFFAFFLTFVRKFLILRIIQRDTITKAHRSSCKVNLFLSNFLTKFGFISADFSKKKLYKYQIIMKMRSVRAELFDAEGRTGGQRTGRRA